MIDINTKTISLNSLGINSSTVHYQLTSNELHSIILQKKQGKNLILERLQLTLESLQGDHQKTAS